MYLYGYHASLYSFSFFCILFGVGVHSVCDATKQAKLGNCN